MNKLHGVALAALAIGLAGPAWAQQGTQSAMAADAEPQVAETGGSGLGDIIVTATKRETNLQQTPISISVLNTQALEDRHALSLIALGDGSIPSLRVATFEARQSALTVGIRGIVPYDANQTARDNGVTVYLDGVALGKTQGLNTSLLDIERIEVLKGPQGTLFGRNTEGGAVSLVSRGASGEFGGRLLGGIGNFGSRNAEAHIDLPEFMNIALKFDGVYQHQDPTLKDPLSGSTGWNYYDRKGGRVQARWEPFAGFSANVSYDQTRDDNTPFYSQLVSYNPNNYPVGVYVNTAAAGATPTYALFTAATGGVPCGGTIAAGSAKPVCVAPKAPIVGVHPERQKVADVGVPQQPSTDLTHGATINLKYNVSPALELRSITAWRGVKTDQWDNSGGPERSTFAPNANFSRYSLSFLRQHQFSQEIQAVGSIPQLDYVVGAYYYTEYATEYAATPLSNQWNVDGTAYTIRSPIVTGTVTSANSGYQREPTPSCINTAIPNLCQFVTRDSVGHDHNYSIFGQATYTPDFADALHLTAGGRWTKDRRRGTLFVVNGVLHPNRATNTDFTFANSISRFDPLVTLAFDATPDVHLYAKYATGFRAGGANDRSQRFDPFGPESVKSYEVGLKADMFDHLARLNVAGYIMDRKNTQFDFDFYDTDVTSITNGAHIEQTKNAGDSKIRGVEVDLTVKPARDLTLGGSYAYTYWRAPKASYTIVNGGTTITSLPQQLYIVYTPKHAASGYIDYAIPVGAGSTTLRAHLDANYSSSYYSFQLEPTKTDSSFIVNGRLSLADIAVGRDGGQKVTFAVWARNLFDEQHIYRRSAANSSPVSNYNGTTLVSTNYGGILGDYANFNPPRTFGGEVSIKF